jgi:hypothetical protein
MSTTDVVFKAKGYENGIQVWSISSIDEAWFVPGKGLVLFGQAMPGKLLGEEVRPDHRGDPPSADFVAALTIKELRSLRPRLHASRFHALARDDRSCITDPPETRLEPTFVHVATPTQPSVWLQDLRNDVSSWQLRLEEQRLVIDAVDEVTPRRVAVALGPHGARPLYYVLYPFALAIDAVRVPIGFAIDRARSLFSREQAARTPTDRKAQCDALMLALFPEVELPPQRVASGP